MIDLVRQYYLDERSNAVPAFVAAAILLALGSLLLLRYAGEPLAKGLGTGLLTVALLLAVVGVSGRVFNDRKLAGLPERAATATDAQLRQDELARMDRVMNVTFRYAFITFGVLMMAAMLLIILTKSGYWRGMALALMVLVALATIGDSFNSRRNQRYLEAVQARVP